MGLFVGSLSRHYADMLHEDLHIRKLISERLVQAGVARIVIERPAKKARVTIHTARPWRRYRQKRRIYRKASRRYRQVDGFGKFI